MSKPVVEKAPIFDINQNFESFQDIFKYFETHGITDDKGRYLHWEQLKYRLPRAEALTIWKAIKFQRHNQMKSISLLDEHNIPFVYCTPHSMEAKLHQIVKIAGGNVSALEKENSSGRIQKQFLVSSLIMEEAITSAQLEGASTTRSVAKKMLEEEREPVDEDERMILNNYLLLKYAESIKDDDLSIDQILEFHRIATSGTTENSVVPGELRQDNDIFVEDGNGHVAHQPPDFNVIFERLLTFCEFANAEHSGTQGNIFIAPVVKAIILHFMIGYEHPFRDGNGRTARAIFYWYMLKSDYDLFKYVSISKLLRQKPREYGLSYLYTEKDQNDLTYFIYFQLDIILSAFDDLESYLNHKTEEFQKITKVLNKTKWGNKLNFIQKDLIEKAAKEPGRIFTVKEITNSYSVTQNTARKHLNELVKAKLFLNSKDGRSVIYIAPSDLITKLHA